MTRRSSAVQQLRHVVSGRAALFTHFKLLISVSCRSQYYPKGDYNNAAYLQVIDVFFVVDNADVY